MCKSDYEVWRQISDATGGYDIVVVLLILYIIHNILNLEILEQTLGAIDH